MKNRLLTGWSLMRGVYLAIGILVLVQAISASQWLGVALGSYVSLMGLFGFGCAGGNCAGGNCEVKPDPHHKK